MRRRALHGGTWIVAALAAAALAGCGENDEATGQGLAALAPADTLVYFEGVVRPEGDEREAIEAIAARFPGGEELGGRIVSELDASLAEEAGDEDAPTYSEDIEPWLGERFAVYLNDVTTDPASGETPATFIAQTTDPEAAAAGIERLAAAGEGEVEEASLDGATYFVADDGSAGGVLGDHVVLATTEREFRDAAAVIQGDGESLASSAPFSYSVGGEDGSQSLAFASLDLRPLIEQGIAADADPDVSADQLDQILGMAGLDAEAPARAVLSATPDSARLDIGLATVGEALDPGAGAELLGSLPAEAWVAAGCPGCLEGFAAAFDLGVEQAAAEDGVSPARARRTLRERLGLDTRELLDGLGSVAVYARGSGLLDLGGAAVAEVEDAESVERGVEAARRLLATQPGVELGALPDLPVQASGFSLSLPDLPVPLNLAAAAERLVVGLGDSATAEALAPEQTLEDSGALGEASDVLEGDFEPSALVDLDQLADVVIGLASGDPRVAQAAPYLEPFAEVVAGARLEGDELVARTVVTFD